MSGCSIQATKSYGCFSGQNVEIHSIYSLNASGVPIQTTRITDAAGVLIVGADASNTTVGLCPLQRPKFRTVQPLNAGANTITHSLSLPVPISSIVDIRDDQTNETILARVSVETANTLVITVATAVPAARITII